MKTLVLSPGVTALEYWYYDDALDVPLYTGCIDDYRNADRCMDALTTILMHVSGSGGTAGPAGAADLVAVRIPYGGALLRAPVPLTEALVPALNTLVPDAPLHLPGPFIRSKHTSPSSTLPASDQDFITTISGATSSSF